MKEEMTLERLKLNSESAHAAADAVLSRIKKEYPVLDSVTMDKLEKEYKALRKIAVAAFCKYYKAYSRAMSKPLPY